MSIKTFHRPEGDQLFVFLVLSVLVHMALVWALASSRWQRARSISPSTPLTVDVVDMPATKKAGELPKEIVKLPPIETQNLSKVKKKATHASDRAQSVVKETYPEPSAGSIGRPARPVVAVPPAPKAQAGSTAQKAARSGSPGGAGAAPMPKKGLPGEETYPEPGKGVANGAAQGQSAPWLPKKPGETIIKPPMPSLFPSEERIAELTHRYETEPQKGERGKVLQLNTSESKYAKYVNDSLVPPIEFRMSRGLAARKGWTGNLLVDFTVKKDGSLGAIELLKSSGNPALDDDTITSLKLASPFPPLPEKFGMDEIKIKGIFVYY